MVMILILLSADCAPNCCQLIDSCFVYRHRFVQLLAGFEQSDQVEMMEDAIKQAQDVQLMAEYSGHLQ